MSFLFLFFLAVQAFALTIPEKPESYVNDYAGLLTAETRQSLEALLAGFEKNTSNQIVVAIFKSLEDEVLEDYSIRLAEKWKIGTKDRDNGVILLIFKDDRAVRIEVGYGLEGALPDALAGQIIQQQIVPHFRAGNFDAGVISAVKTIMLATKGEYNASPQRASDKIEKFTPFIFMCLVFYMLVPLVCYFFVFLLSFLFFGAPGLAAGAFIVLFLILLRKALGVSLFGQTISGRRSGWGGFSSGGFGGGGFSGGGGGSFGGGGASGRW